MIPHPSFGQILRERRSWLGWTQAELARRVGCAPITIRKIEGDTLRPSVQLAKLLAQALNIPEAEQAGFIQLARQENPPISIPAPALTPQQIAALANPYQGLRPFTEAEADNFCGRDRMIEALITQMSDGSAAERFLAVVGPSGSGKSSLVNAGLLPKVRQGALPDSEKWLIANFTPGAKPWDEMVSSLLQLSANPAQSLLEDLQRDRLSLLRVAEKCLPDDDEVELLLVMDQFEELFTLVEDEAVREHFLQSVVTAVLNPQSRLRVVVTLRADFTGRPLQHRAFGELMQQRLILVLPLTPDELSQAITKPIEKLGLRMAPELTTTMIQEVGSHPGMLPLLQYALTELFEQRQGQIITLETYQQTRGVTGALFHRAEEIFNGFTEAEQDATRQLFLRLITLGKGVEDTRRRVLLSELEELPDQLTNSPIEQFSKYRLLTFDHDPASRRPTVEVAHEALLREWSRLRGWLDDSREDVRRQRMLLQAAGQWEQNGHDDSYLLRGNRLTSFQAWAETSTVVLTIQERSFLQKSIATRDERHAAEEARRQRELETAQRLAEEQTRRAEEQAQAAQSLRQRAIYLAGALFFVAVLSIIAFFLAQSANQNADLALANERDALESYSLSLAANARQALEADDQPLALLLALAANGVENPPVVAWRTLVDIAYAPGVNRQFEHSSPINEVAVGADGRFLLTGSDDGLMLLWDVASGEIVQTYDGHLAAVKAVAFSPDGQMALSGGADDVAILWNLTSGEILQQLVGHKGDVSGVAFTPDGQFAVTSEDTAAAPSDLIVWELATGEIVRQFGGTVEGNPEGILDMALSGDGRFALVGQFSYANNNAQQTVLWNVNTGELVHVLSAIDRTVDGIAVSPDGRFGLAGAVDHSIYQWDLGTGALVQRLDGHEGAVLAVAFNANGKQALSASLDQTLIWWDLETGEIIHRFQSGAGEIHSLHFLNNNQAVTASTNGTVQIWDLVTAWQLARWGEAGSGHLPPAAGTLANVMGLAISPNGRYAISGGNEPDMNLILWDYETGAERQRFAGTEGDIFDIAFYPNSERVLVATQSGLILEWDLITGAVERQLEGHQATVNGVEISGDGRFAVSGSLDSSIIYWDLQTGQILQRMYGHFEGRGVYDVTFLPDEQHAVSSSWDGTMIIWDLQQGEQVERLTGLLGEVGSHFAATGDWGIHGIDLSPDGTHLLSGGRDETLLLWELQRGQTVQRLVGHTGVVVDVEYAPDGRMVLSSAQNDSLIVWDMATGTPIRRLAINNRMNSAFQPAVAVHPDGRTALSTDADGSILKWQLAEPTAADLVTWLGENRTLRELTCAERETYGIEPLCVDGVATATTADMLAAVQMGAFNSQESESDDLVELFDSQPIVAQVKGTAVLGENRGELVRHQFDVWTYEGKAGEILQFQLIADNPLTDVTIPLEARHQSGMLDTLLFLVGPDGALVTRANDDPADDGTFHSDANVEAIVLPKDGTYRIEARSFLDDGAGAYTLLISPRNYEIDVELLKEYEGHYLEGPWEYNMNFYVLDGRFFVDIEQSAETFELIPLSDTEFLWSDGSRNVFIHDENGEVTGYKTWISLVHPIGGQWYDAVKLDE